MQNEKIKTPLTKPATPVSKRSGQFKAIASDGEGLAAVEQALDIEELADEDVELDPS